MTHKTLIGGTAYEITGGKTMIGGTAYDIIGGKTLIGGTAYNVVSGKTLINNTAYQINFSKLTVEDVFASVNEVLYSQIETVTNTTNKRKLVFSTSGTYFVLALYAETTARSYWTICEVSFDGTTATIVNTWDASYSPSFFAFTVNGATLSTPAGDYALTCLFALRFSLELEQLRSFFQNLTDDISLENGKSQSTNFTLSAYPFTGHSFTHACSVYASTYSSFFGVASLTSAGAITPIWGIGFRERLNRAATSLTLENKSLLRYDGSNMFFVSENGIANYTMRSGSIWGLI